MSNMNQSEQEIQPNQVSTTEIADQQEQPSQIFVPQMQVQNQFLPSKGHPLQTNWKFYYVQRQNLFQPLVSQNEADDQHQPQKKRQAISYRDRLKDMGTISTVEQFFQYFVYMKKPQEMPREIDLFFFRENEIPMWEVRS